MLRYISLRSSKWDRDIEALDARDDAATILDILMTRVFPLDVLVSLELAQIRTFTIPSISALLHKTRQYEDHGEKRIDDTKGILTSLTEDGLDSDRGQQAATHLNRIHSFYDISNDDFLYTLSTFIFEPILWIKRYGWRDFSEKETLALFYFFSEMGRAMHIKDIPESIESFWQWRLDYEEQVQVHDENNTLVTMGLINSFNKRVPRLFRPLIKAVLATVIGDDHIRKVLGLKTPRILTRALVAFAMKARGLFLRVFTVWDKLEYRSTRIYNDYPTYPNGFKLSDLGPETVLQKMKERSK
jgi:hypothetical protein